MSHSTHDAPSSAKGSRVSHLTDRTTTLSGWTPAKLSRQSTGSPDLSPRVSASFAGMPLVVKREATDALLDVQHGVIGQ